MGLQIPLLHGCVCTECVWRASSGFTGTVAAGLAASLQFFKSRWMKESGRKEHCAQLLLLLLLHTAVYLVFFRPMSIKWERRREKRKKKHTYAHTQHNTTQQLHRCFIFFDEKRRGRVGGEARNNEKKKKTQMESDTSSGIRGAHFIFWCLPVSMTTAALTGRAYGAALPAGGNNVWTSTLRSWANKRRRERETERGRQ